MGFNVHLPSVLLLFASFYDSSIENNVERARRRKETAKGIEGEEEPKLASALEENRRQVNTEMCCTSPGLCLQKLLSSPVDAT
jgi:hypothetical protein